MQNKNLSVEESLTLAIQNHKKNFKAAENLYKKVLEINSNNTAA